jgi:hypothetical protein
MNYKKIFYSIVSIIGIHLILIGNLFAGDKDRLGTASGEQLLIPVGARDLAMGGADLSLTSGVDAIFWNPAGLAHIKTSASIQFSTMSIFDDVQVNYIGLGFDSGDFGVLGVSIKAFSFGDIPLTTVEDMDGASGQTFSPTFTTLGLSYARAFTEATTVGVTAKVIYESIPRATASAFAVDVGVQYKTNIDGLAIGLAVKNLGTNMQYSGSAFLGQSNDISGAFTDFRERPVSSSQLPSSMEVGLSYKRSIGEESAVIIAGDFQHYNLGLDGYKFGGEYGFNDMVFVRAGYLLTPNADKEAQLYGLSLGLGGHINLNGMDIVIDYAYRDVQFYDGESLFSLRIGF